MGRCDRVSRHVGDFHGPDGQRLSLIFVIPLTVEFGWQRGAVSLIDALGQYSTSMSETRDNGDDRVAVLVDCDSTSSDILEFALRVVAQFGCVVLRRGYGNDGTLANKWQEVLVGLTFTPCIQYQYSSDKNTSDWSGSGSRDIPSLCPWSLSSCAPSLRRKH